MEQSSILLDVPSNQEAFDASFTEDTITCVLDSTLEYISPVSCPVSILKKKSTSLITYSYWYYKSSFLQLQSEFDQDAEVAGSVKREDLSFDKDNKR